MNNNKTLDNILKKQENMLVKYGYCYHALANNTICDIDHTVSNEFINNSCDIHTHGLIDSFNHPELRIVSTFYGIDTSMRIIDTIAMSIRDNRFKYYSGSSVSIMVDDVEYIIDLIDDVDEANVLRIIFRGILEENQEQYLNQFKSLALSKYCNTTMKS